MVLRHRLIRVGLPGVLAGVWIVAGATVLYAQSTAEKGIAPRFATNGGRAVETMAASFLPPDLGPIVVPPFEARPILNRDSRGVLVPTAAATPVSSTRVDSAPVPSRPAPNAREQQDESNRERGSVREEPAPRRNADPMPGLSRNAP